jgi:dipeptidase E
MRLLLLSNSRNPGGGYLAHAREALCGFLGTPGKRLLFFPFAAVRIAFDDYARRVRAALAPLGHTLVAAHRAPLARAIREADAFVVGGGNTFCLLDAMQRNGALTAIEKRVRKGTPYIGWSAGSNLACPTIRTTNDMPIVEPRSLDAMGLVPFQLNPHYTERALSRHGGETRDERIAEFLAKNPRVAVLGLREGTLLRVEGRHATVELGPGARLFRHRERRRDLEAGADVSFLL